MAGRPAQFYTPPVGGPPPVGWQSTAGPGPGDGFDDFAGPGGPQAGPSNRRGGAAINDMFYGAGSNFIRTGLGAYGEKILGSGRTYMQNNVSRYFSGQDISYYFQVNDQFVRNKLKVLFCPFLHKGHWTRLAEQMPGGAGLTFKAPKYDINAPDLYIPIMAFGTYVLLSSLALGLASRTTPKNFPKQVHEKFSWGLVAWLVEVVLLRSSLYMLGGSEVALLDMVAYAGYAFAGISLSVLFGIFNLLGYYIVTAWTALCFAVFLVKTLKRVLFSETRGYDRDGSQHHYILLMVAATQFPFFLLMGRL